MLYTTAGTSMNWPTPVTVWIFTSCTLVSPVATQRLTRWFPSSNRWFPSYSTMIIGQPKSLPPVEPWPRGSFPRASVDHCSRRKWTWCRWIFRWVFDVHPLGFMLFANNLLKTSSPFLSPHSEWRWLKRHSSDWLRITSSLTASRTSVLEYLFFACA